MFDARTENEYSISIYNPFVEVKCHITMLPP
jgi:hypothetical protein